MDNPIDNAFTEALQLYRTVCSDANYIKCVHDAADVIASALRTGGKLIIAGNGGSAADAQHFVAEVVGRFQKERRGLPAIALSTNTSTITALANDYSYDDIFARQLDALGTTGDVFFGITTSGKSPNILRALKVAAAKKIPTIGLLGKEGGPCAPMCDFSIIVPHNVTARIQEVHILTIHAICAAIDEAFE